MKDKKVDVKKLDSAIDGIEGIVQNLKDGLKYPGEDKQQAKWLDKELKKLKEYRTQIHGTGTGND